MPHRALDALLALRQLRKLRVQRAHLAHRALRAAALDQRLKLRAQPLRLELERAAARCGRGRDGRGVALGSRLKHELHDAPDVGLNNNHLIIALKLIEYSVIPLE